MFTAERRPQAPAGACRRQWPIVKTQTYFKVHFQAPAGVDRRRQAPMTFYRAPLALDHWYERLSAPTACRRLSALRLQAPVYWRLERQRCLKSPKFPFFKKKIVKMFQAPMAPMTGACRRRQAPVIGADRRHRRLQAPVTLAGAWNKRRSAPVTASDNRLSAPIGADRRQWPSAPVVLCSCTLAEILDTI